MTLERVHNMCLWNTSCTYPANTTNRHFNEVSEHYHIILVYPPSIASTNFQHRNIRRPQTPSQRLVAATLAEHHLPTRSIPSPPPPFITMPPHFSFFTAALKSFALRPKLTRPTPHTRISQFICRTCQQKFSTSPSLRLFGRAAKKPVEKERSSFTFPMMTLNQKR
jgi:hypothetical protein